jgi:hypothetical protein
MTLGLFDVGFLGGLGAGVALDPDAQAYITAVEAADGQALETAVRTAINDFVVGCKADGIWNAIKASCVLAGARTLNGCLVPLAGAAPTNFNFAAGDYNRKTGLVGDGSTKYLNSNRNNNADPQNNNHNACFVSTATSVAGALMGTSTGIIGHNNIFADVGGPNGLFMRSRSAVLFAAGSATATGFAGHSRNGGDSFQARIAAITQTAVRDSGSPVADSVELFRRGAGFYTNARLAFYSIGESLDLALLDARVTALINAFAAVIP